MVPPLSFSFGSKGLLVEGSQGSVQSNIQIAKGVNTRNNNQKKFPKHFSKKSLIFFAYQSSFTTIKKNLFQARL